MYAEDIGSYWKTSHRTSPDEWLEKAKREIIKAKGIILGEGFGSEPQTGRAAYMLAFAFKDERFKLIWPILPSRTKNEKAARIQAATMLYHDVKARCMTAKVLGPRIAFFSYLMLSNGQTASQVADVELLESIPKFLVAPSQSK